jgi:hypothetical protein
LWHFHKKTISARDKVFKPIIKIAVVPVLAKWDEWDGKTRF